RRLQPVDDVAQNGIAGHRHQAFGLRVGVGAQARANAGNRNNGFHTAKGRAGDGAAGRKWSSYTTVTGRVRILPRSGHQPLTSGSGCGDTLLISHRWTSKLTASTQKPQNLMKRLLLYFAALVTLLSQSSCGYNGMVQRDQAVKGQWANVQSAYQRRADLIPNLVNTVKGAANFEKSTLEGVVEARAKATSVQLNADQLTPENIQKFQAAQSQLSAGLGRLLAVSENYPELKANANFQELQAQIEGTENRINVERNKFNTATNDYNGFEAALVAAIQQAELRTSGEVRLHIEEKCPTPEPLDRAAQVFAELKMHQTKLRNGVLFYLAWQSRQFAVVGDAGINSTVPDDFWESVKETVVGHFRQEQYALGLERGIRLVGEQLRQFFPYDAATDPARAVVVAEPRAGSAGPGGARAPFPTPPRQRPSAGDAAAGGSRARAKAG
nr:hypothetical protein [Tanacetum cinerariifolium]